MSDKEFDFHRPAERREAKRFEPPPWEREAFEELQRRKAEQEASEQPPPSSSEEPAPEQSRPDPSQAEENAEAVPVPASQASAGDRPEPTVAQKPQVPEHVVMEMMAELSAEEPSIQPAVHTISLISALTVAAIGTVMMLWGMAALVGSRTTGAIGAFGGAVLLFFGAAAIAGAVWLAVRTLRQRGVL